MRIIKHILALILVICISIIHIHCSLYTIGNSFNPVTVVALFMKGEDTYMFFTAYSAQFLVTLIAAYFILKFRRMKIWLIVYLLGAFVAHWIDDYSPFSHLPVFESSTIAALYEKFYGYGQAFMLGVYYVSVQLFVLVLYMFFVGFARIPVIKRIDNRVAGFIDIFTHSEFYKKVCRNKYALGTVILIIALFCMIIYIIHQ